MSLADTPQTLIKRRSLWLGTRAEEIYDRLRQAGFICRLQGARVRLEYDLMLSGWREIQNCLGGDKDFSTLRRIYYRLIVFMENNERDHCTHAFGWSFSMQCLYLERYTPDIGDAI